METKIKTLNKDLEFNPNNQTISIYGKETKLTTKESELLDTLSDNVNNLTERKEVLLKVWGEDIYYTARSMDVYICKLRKLLMPVKGVEILNVHGKGYKLIINQN